MGKSSIWDGSNDLQSLIRMTKQYLQHLQIKDFSSRTIETYRRRLTYFLNYCHERGIVCVWEVNQEVLEKYKRFLDSYQTKRGQQSLLPESKDVYLRTVCRFFHWLEKNQLILSNPAVELNFIKVARCPRHDVLTCAEVECVINQANISTVLGIRDRAILEVFYSCGIRGSELIHLKINDVDLEYGILTVIEGKGKKDRVVPLGDRAVCWVRKYLVQSRPSLSRGTEGQTLFLTIRGNALNIKNLSRSIAG